MTNGSNSAWRLCSKDGRLIAELRPKSFVMPWIEADVINGPAWDGFSPLFAAHIRANDLAAETDDWDEADRLYYQIRDVTILVDPDGAAVPEYLLHLDGATATWRWADEPFD